MFWESWGLGLNFVVEGKAMVNLVWDWLSVIGDSHLLRSKGEARGVVSGVVGESRVCDAMEGESLWCYRGEQYEI